MVSLVYEELTQFARLIIEDCMGIALISYGMCLHKRSETFLQQ